MTSLYEIYYQEMHKQRLADAEAARAVKEATKHNQTANGDDAQSITAVLQKYRIKFVDVYHTIYQQSKRLLAVWS